MRKFKCEILYLLAIIFAVCFVQQVFACSCRGIPTPYQSFQNSEAVFVGKVTDVLDSSGNQVIENVVDNFDLRFEGERIYQFKVDEWFKGEKTKEVKVLLRLNMCQFGLDRDEKLLVYANSYNGQLSTWTFCSRTRNVEFAKDDITFIRELLNDRPEPRIYGSVRFGDSGLENINYLEGIKIVARNGKRKYVTYTGKNGTYRFNKLPNGKYSVLPVLPKKYVISPLGMLYFLQEINLISDNAFQLSDYDKISSKNVYTDFSLTWNNQISGKVLDAEGKSLDYATVKLIPAEKINQIEDKPLSEEQAYRQYLSKESPQSSVRKYSISSQTPGKYILAVEVFAPFAPNKDRFRMYYPQTTNPEEAKIIELNEFDRQNIDIKLPAEFIVREVEGVFNWGSGNPIDDGWIKVSRFENSDTENNTVYGLERTKKGKFKFQLFENAEYCFEASVFNEITKSLKVKVGKTNAPIKITLWLLKNK
jgi:hypothetical protein